ncbi:hypothetical protein [Nocardia macrotermitis]|uniref:hypothetical protein n=1 Tax=Nocardia macrotermitis TaxID=2585198 RepID=UPI001D0FE7B7|nr:hypothetical protein [Nocardia macrotermitis]
MVQILVDVRVRIRVAEHRVSLRVGETLGRVDVFLVLGFGCVPGRFLDDVLGLVVIGVSRPVRIGVLRPVLVGLTRPVLGVATRFCVLWFLLGIRGGARLILRSG